eukprot:CAMPEP_0172817720 /NCGR_PEP_ID=MMETSP1075-20121228/13421_1 /TAXON_ID=2916 /ORGANISM="Ceratium fusus, Strain PA161109" /LENGTH=72 /DNA_ID=CAMNT_0013657979 /DNA_START=31 /DNA_END=249 /DNA_ORIENTATION=-
MAPMQLKHGVCDTCIHTFPRSSHVPLPVSAAARRASATTVVSARNSASRSREKRNIAGINSPDPTTSGSEPL